MCTQTNYPKPSIYMGSAVFCMVFAFLVLGGCPPPPPTGPGPGKPDEMQWQHYQMFKSAIENENKVNALVALDLYEQDISRWYADKTTEATAISELKILREAVDNEDWASAAKILSKLESKYRSEGE